MRGILAYDQSPRRRRTGPLQAMARILIRILFLIPVVAAADVVIEFTDGRRITVPVDHTEIESIRFTKTTSTKGRGPQTSRDQSPSPADRSRPTVPEIWRVGPERALKYPSDAAKKAKDGDTVEIDAGTYHNDYVKWNQSDLTIRGVGGMAHLKSKGLIPNRKAIWILNGNNTLIENIEFSGAAVKDTNGAGIRHQGGDLTLRNSFFHDNEFSILSGKSPESRITIMSSRFWFQKRKKRHSHGIYIGNARRLTLIGNHFKGTDKGHQIKTRALENHILYNRIEDIPGGNTSRLIDLSNCGLSFVIGNDLHQGATTDNSNVIGYGPEQCMRRNEQQMKLYVVNNTLINEARGGSFVKNFAGGDVFIANNLIFGAGDLLAGDGEETNNVRLSLSDRESGTWNAPSGSTAIDAAAELPEAEGVSLLPAKEFTPPAGTRPRPQSGMLDVGSRERAR